MDDSDENVRQSKKATEAIRRCPHACYSCCTNSMVLLVGHFARHTFRASDEPAAAHVGHHSGPHERALRKSGECGPGFAVGAPGTWKCGGSKIEDAWRLARLPKCDLTDQCAVEKSPIADLNH